MRFLVREPFGPLGLTLVFLDSWSGFELLQAVDATCRAAGEFPGIRAEIVTWKLSSNSPEGVRGTQTINHHGQTRKDLTSFAAETCGARRRTSNP